MRFLTLIIYTVIFNTGYSSCIPKVNKDKPRAGIPGGQFNGCKINTQTGFCNPINGDENYMTRHHIFDKQLWIEVLDNGLNHSNYGFDQAKEKIKGILRFAGASDTVISDFDQDGKACNSETNKWLTWLPVNLSLGPAPEDRSFDPANDFDNWALMVVPDQDAKSTLNNIHTAVINYDNDAIAQNLAKLPAVKAPWQMTLGDNANWVKAYDTYGKQKYCPKEVFDGYGISVCPNSDVSLLTSYNPYSQAA